MRPLNAGDFLESQLVSFPAACGELYLAVMPRRGLSAVDGVEGLPRGGKQRAQIFTFKMPLAVVRVR
jgi:hypothetical protein